MLCRLLALGLRLRIAGLGRLSSLLVFLLDISLNLLFVILSLLCIFWLLDSGWLSLLRGISRRFSEDLSQSRTFKLSYFMVRKQLGGNGVLGDQGSKDEPAVECQSHQFFFYQN